MVEVVSPDALAGDSPRRFASPRWLPAVFSIFRRLECGMIELETPDGRVLRAEGARPGPKGRIIVHDARLFGRMLRDGEMGFCEAYLDGWWSSPDLQATLDVLLLNNESVARGFPGVGLVRRLNRLRHLLRRNTKRQARRNIEAHYDLSNDFYALWLDPSMTYSSALFETGVETLEQAQRAKYAAICDRLDLAPGQHVLEIGCGWGGFAEFAARERGLRVTGLTLSPAQLDFAQARMRRLGLEGRVDLVLRDYRDEQGVYDGVASIEMFEAIGEENWASYFDCVRARLKPDGRAALQIITISDHLFESYRTGVDFVQKHVFPGGMLPSVAELRRETARAGLEWEDLARFGDSYSRTLRLWLERFDAVRPEIERLQAARRFDGRFRRLWRLYLTSCAACFRAGTADVTHITLRRR